MPNIEVCLSPLLINLYNISAHVVVVVDVLRASSSIVTGIAHGVKSIVPVENTSQCKSFIKQGFFFSGERDGKKIVSFDMGNSPYEFMDEKLMGGNIVMTTTNGTHAIKLSEKAINVIIGSFLNLDAIVDYLLFLKKDLLIFCAGWKGKISIEDTLFAGALSEKLIKNSFNTYSDEVSLSMVLYTQAKADLYQYIAVESSYAKRLKNETGNLKDLAFCTRMNIFNNVPILKDKKIVNLN